MCTINTGDNITFIVGLGIVLGMTIISGVYKLILLYISYMRNALDDNNFKHLDKKAFLAALCDIALGLIILVMFIRMWVPPFVILRALPIAIVVHFVWILIVKFSKDSKKSEEE